MKKVYESGKDILSKSKNVARDVKKYLPEEYKGYADTYADTLEAVGLGEEVGGRRMVKKNDVRKKYA